MTGSGQRLDGRARAGADAVWARALSGLTAELRSHGLEARIDGRTGVVEARRPLRPAAAGALRAQRAVLRPHRGRLYWWLRWEDEQAPNARRCALQHTPLTPAADVGAAARRIAGVMVPEQRQCAADRIG
ncbi:hypothetical protein [Nocardiopsis coralliicola]